MFKITGKVPNNLMVGGGDAEVAEAVVWLRRHTRG